MHAFPPDGGEFGAAVAVQVSGDFRQRARQGIVAAAAAPPLSLSRPARTSCQARTRFGVPSGPAECAASGASRTLSIAISQTVSRDNW